METAIISAEINKADLPILEVILEKFKAKSIIIKEKNNSKMTEKEFFAKIDQARNSIKNGNYKTFSSADEAIKYFEKI